MKDEDDVKLVSRKDEYSPMNGSERGNLPQTYLVLNSRSFIRAGLILMAEFCERMAFYSIDSNLLLVFLAMNLVPSDANMLALFWKGTGYITPLIGGILADGYFGRFKTILIFLVVYVISMVLLAVGVLDWAIHDYSWITFVALFLIAIAMGGIKANVVTFGADQFQGYSERTQQAFFNWFYFSINLGSILSFTVVSYVQQNISLWVGLIIPAIVMFFAAVFFVVGSPLYDKFEPSGSVLGKFIKLIVDCIKVGKSQNPSDTFLDRARYIVDQDGKRKYQDDTIEDLRTLSRVLPIQACLIVFWCTYAQLSSVIFTQGTVLNLKLGDISVPVSFLNTFNAAVILILVPIFDRLLYPFLARMNINFNPLRRIGLGLIMASLAMLYAGGLEIYRKQLFLEGKVIRQVISEKVITAVDLSIFWQAPAFIFVGTGEVLASITGLQFAYDEAPVTMRSLVAATNLLSTGFGSYLGLVLVAIVNAVSSHSPWIADDTNRGHLDLYFLTLCILGLLNFYIFLFLSSKYKFRNK